MKAYYIAINMESNEHIICETRKSLKDEKYKDYEHMAVMALNDDEAIKKALECKNKRIN